MRGWWCYATGQRNEGNQKGKGADNDDDDDVDDVGGGDGGKKMVAMADRPIIEVQTLLRDRLSEKKAIIINLETIHFEWFVSYTLHFLPPSHDISVTMC